MRMLGAWETAKDVVMITLVGRVVAFSFSTHWSVLGFKNTTRSFPSAYGVEDVP